MRRARPFLPLVAATVLVLLLSGCGSDDRRTALAVTEVRWAEPGTLVVTTECAELDEGTGEPGPAAGDPYRIQLWGRPKLGRCTAEWPILLPPDTVQLLDETTSKVIDLPPAP